MSLLPVLLVASTQPPGADQTRYAGMMFMLVVLTVLSEPVALGLGIAGGTLGSKPTLESRGSDMSALRPSNRTG